MIVHKMLFWVKRSKDYGNPRSLVSGKLDKKWFERGALVVTLFTCGIWGLSSTPSERPSLRERTGRWHQGARSGEFASHARWALPFAAHRCTGRFDDFDFCLQKTVALSVLDNNRSSISVWKFQRSSWYARATFDWYLMLNLLQNKILQSLSRTNRHATRCKYWNTI